MFALNLKCTTYPHLMKILIIIVIGWSWRKFCYVHLKGCEWSFQVILNCGIRNFNKFSFNREFIFMPFGSHWDKRALERLRLQMIHKTRKNKINCREIPPRINLINIVHIIRRVQFNFFMRVNFYPFLGLHKKERKQIVYSWGWKFFIVIFFMQVSWKLICMEICANYLKPFYGELPDFFRGVK